MYLIAEANLLTLLTFSRGILSWPAFWEVISSWIDQQSVLDYVMKFNYMLGCLKVLAKKSISGLGITAQNFSVAIGILCGKYVQYDWHHHSHLLLQSAGCTVVHPCAMQSLTTEGHHLIRVRNLPTWNLGENLDHQGLLIMGLLGKFPRDNFEKLEKPNWSGAALGDGRRMDSPQTFGGYQGVGGTLTVDSWWELMLPNPVCMHSLCCHVTIVTQTPKINQNTNTMCFLPEGTTHITAAHNTHPSVAATNGWHYWAHIFFLSRP